MVIEDYFNSQRVMLILSGLLMIITWPGVVQANGGMILLVEEVGAYELTITASPYPLQVGTNDVNALVERASDQLLVLDAQVIMIIEPLDQPDEAQTFPATHDTATNKLYYHANIVFPTPGRWRFTVKVDGLEDAVNTTFETQVEPAQATGFLRYLSLVGLPLVLIAFLFFVLSRRAKEAFNGSGENEDRCRLQPIRK